MLSLALVAAFALAGPAAALPAALPAAPLEVREGTLGILMGDDFEAGHSRAEYVLDTDGERVPLSFDSSPPADWKTGDAIHVEGRSSDTGFRVQASERLSIARPDGALAANAWTTGAKKALVMLVNFQNDVSQPYTVAQAQATMFGATGSVAAYYAEVSNGNTTLTGDVTTWLTLPITKPTTCDYFSVSTHAQTAAAAAGYSLANYQFPIYVFPSMSCGWAGLGYVGAGGAWINQTLSTYVVGHELGHNYGLEHAHSYDCGASAFSPTCGRGEYGDPFDIMGGNTRHFGAFSKQQLAWLPAGAVVTTSTGTTTTDLSPIESAAGVRGVQVLTTKGRTYWVESRQATGFDSGIGTAAVNGLLIKIAPSPYDGGTDLLDTTPDGSTSSGSFGDSPLAVGQVFIDPAAGVSVTAVAKNGSLFTVRVDYGTFPGPSVSGVSPPSGSAAGGTVVTISGTGFLPAVGVSIGGSAAAPTAIASTSVAAKTGAHAVGDADVVLTNADLQTSTLPKAFFYDFADVLAANPFHGFVVKLFRDSVATGCGSNNYCPASSVTRGQMSVFLLRSKEGPTYTPPACSTQVFSDVPCSNGFAAWINELAARGVTAGCGGGAYCTNTPVTRGQMAVLLLRTREGSAYAPPPCTTAPFSDVSCSSGLAVWIQELVARGITAGCGSGNYCPDSPATRGQMAVFLVSTFTLP